MGPRIQLAALGNQKKGRRFFACGRLSLVSSENYKTSAQAGAATCQRQAQAFWFVYFTISPSMIYARSAKVNRIAALSDIGRMPRFPCVQSIAKKG